MMKTWIAFITFLIVLSTPLLAQDPEQGARGRNKRIFVVPRSAPVTIDGDLKDWDLSGQIRIYVTKETISTQSARIALMHDDAALYISGNMRDPSPMMNRHDPLVDAAKAWDADAFQLRLALDPKSSYPLNIQGASDQVVHLTLWEYTDRNEANLHIATGMKYAPRAGFPQGVAPHNSFEGAYKKGADGKSYTFEYRIPWSTLGAKTTPRAGDILASAIQIQWGAPDGLSSTGGGWAMDLMNGPGFSFQSTAVWGKAIFTDKNHLPQTLVSAGDESTPAPPPTPLSFSYTLPASGEVSIGIYDKHKLLVRQLLAQAPRKAGRNIERWNGLDDLGKPLPAGEYSWRGLIHGPITTRYVMGVHNSGRPSYPTPDGRGAWGADHGQPAAVCSTGDAMLLAWDAAEAGCGIIKTDLNGRKLWGIKPGAVHLAADAERFYTSGGRAFFDGSGVQVFSLADGRPLNFGRGTPKIEEPAGGDKESNTVTGLAYRNEVLYVSYGKRNLIGLYDARQGTLKSTLEVPSPQRLAIRNDGTILVISNGRVLTLCDGKNAPLITANLDAPQSIALDAQGDIYVANSGSLQNVAVFDANGKFLRSIGKKGGRPRVGRYDASGMLEPGGIAIDRSGQLWVAETRDSPRRISVWSTRQARPSPFLKEFFGGSQYATFLSMDPNRPNEAYCHMTIWDIDLQKGTWSPRATMWRATKPNMVEAAYERVRVFTGKNGRQFAWGRSSYSNILYRRDSDVFKPIVAGIIVAKGSPFIAWPPYPIFADNEKYPNGAYYWQDANDDQTIQSAEITKLPATGSEMLFNWVDADLNLYADAGYIIRPSKFEKGSPRYDFSKVEKLPVKGNGEFGGLWIDPYDGSFYTIRDSGDRGIFRHTRTGQLLWQYRVAGSWRSTLNKPIARPGQVWGVTAPLGVAGEFTGVATYFGPFHLFTRDGLYVAKIFKDARLGESDAATINAEAFSGQLVKLKNGKYYLLAGDTDGRISEVLGLDTVKRLTGGKFDLSESDVHLARATQDEYSSRQAGRMPLVIARGKSALSVAPSVHKTMDETHGFEVKAARDDQNLYLQYRVSSPYELVNSMGDPRIIFKGGNLLDFQIATGASADAQRVKPAPGDVRVLISRREDGKPVAVLFRPKIKDFKGEPEVLKSPTGRESFDAIADISDKITLEYQKTDKGFSALATLPLGVLQWQPQDATLVKMDVGYLFGNAGGNQIAQRLYWSNASPTSGIIGDVPSEARLEPDRWGTVIVE
jgi:hypothetical protein